MARMLTWLTEDAPGAWVFPTCDRSESAPRSGSSSSGSSEGSILSNGMRRATLQPPVGCGSLNHLLAQSGGELSIHWNRLVRNLFSKAHVSVEVAARSMSWQISGQFPDNNVARIGPMTTSSVGSRRLIRLVWYLLLGSPKTAPRVCYIHLSYPRLPSRYPAGL